MSNARKTRVRVDNTVNKVRVATTRDHQFTFDTYGAYLQMVMKPFDSLKIIPGYRVDKVLVVFLIRPKV